MYYIYQMNIKENCVVSINYTLTDSDGNVLDKTDDHPVAYLHGSGSLISGLEKVLDGKMPGDNIKITVDPDEAYGEFQPQLVQEVSIEMFDGADKVEPGMEFEAMGEDDDESMVIRIDSIDGDRVTINGNHPFAGMTLNFDVDVVDVREASEVEIEHGHVH